MLHMEQKGYKDYKLEIVNELLSNANHIRGIAKKLGTNHMNIVRKIKELAKENAVDFKEEGRNKVYFLKHTIESKNYVFSAENYKLNKLLKKYPILRSVIEKIQNDKRIKLAVLFGSYAKGIAKLESDIDIYIDTANKTIKGELSLINSKLSIKIGDYNKSNLLIREIEKNHVILKDVDDTIKKAEVFNSNLLDFISKMNNENINSYRNKFMSLID